MTMSNSESRKRESKNLAADQLRYAAENLRGAKEYYTYAIETGIKAGMTNVKMAQILGKTEAAVRMYRKRKGLDEPQG